MSEPLNLRDQVAIAVSLAEGQFREFKSAYEGASGQKQKRPVKAICKDVGEALVAFANADGGELIIGVEDDGTLTGIDDFNAEALEQIRLASTHYVHQDTPLQSVLCRKVKLDDNSVMSFRVTKGTRQIHQTSDGRCLKRNDLETIPVSAETIMYDRREVMSREYDREFVDGASVADLDNDLIEVVAEQISQGISIDRCLQYLGMAVYDGSIGLRLRRAALLLFAKQPERWHPRIQVRIIRVGGTKLGSGATYNVSSDTTINENIVRLIDEAWGQMRPHLVATKFQDDARFRTTFLYPEVACREALVNAIAHRDYSEEGIGIEIYVFEDRIEVKNPGGLLSSLSLSDIMSLRGSHQSRNSYVTRTLREMGIMRELGEGMRRIFEVMKSSELAQPEILSDTNSFSLTLHHRPMYASDEVIWLEQYVSMDLSADEKAVILLGRRGDLIAPNDIIRRLGIIDIEHYRQVVHSLQTRGVLETTMARRNVANAARSKGVGRRDVGRFRVKNAPEAKPGRIHVGARQRVERRTVDRNVITDQSHSVYLGNIPPNTNERDIIGVLSDMGHPETVVIPRRNGLSKGYAFVEFSNGAMVELALGAQLVLGGRKLVVRRKHPRRT